MPEPLRLPKAEEIISEATFFIDKVMYRLYSLVMPGSNDILERMKQRLIHECKRLTAVRNEMTALSEPYNRFLDLREEQIKREKRAAQILGVLGPEPDLPEELLKAADFGNPDVVTTSGIPLWEAMREYLQFVPEARIGEMTGFLGDLMGFKRANRQAVESVLKRHPDVFKVRKKNRDKYISLKDSAREER
jgi:hypothetical protein